MTTSRLFANILRSVALAVCVVIALPARVAQAQALPTATGPGTYISAGGGLSLAESDYGQRHIAGGWIYSDVQPTWRIGIETGARYLRLHTDEGVTETSYLVGPRFVFKPGGLRPYVKCLVGVGEITLPFHYGQGRFFAYAPGGGVDYAIGQSVDLRVVDLEYQMWPSFAPFGQLHPYGISTGVSLRLGLVDRRPRGMPRSGH